MHIIHLILELHLKVKGVRKRQDVLTLSNLEVGIRVVAKHRNNTVNTARFMKKTQFSCTNQDKKGQNFIVFSHLQ